MGNVYEACSKEETKTQYHFSIISNALNSHGGFIVDGTNMKMEFLVEKGWSYRSSSITLTNEQPIHTSDKQLLSVAIVVYTCK